MMEITMKTLRIFPVDMLLVLLVFISQYWTAWSQGPEGYFDGTSYVKLHSLVNINGRSSLSFRTCSYGQLLYQEGTGSDYIELSLLPSGQLQLGWRHDGQNSAVYVGSNFNDNRWHDVDMVHNLGSVTLSVDRQSVLVANGTYNSDLFELHLGNVRKVMFVGQGFTGCILQGASVVLNVSSVESRDVVWQKCPLPDHGSCDGFQTDQCFSQPCHKNSKCVSLADSYQCICTARYTGRNCEVDLGPLCERPQYNQCLNGGVCQEDMIGNSTKCACLPQFIGIHCETMVENTFCDNRPCRNGGTCNINLQRDNYICTCPQGFAGNDCELNIDECQSHPCQNNGTCTDEINSYTCDCSNTGYRGPNCEMNINECEENNPCYTGSACFDRYGDYMCDCPPGFGGKNCDQEVNECDSNPCLNGGTCEDNLNAYLCHCPLGFAGVNCNINIDDCIYTTCPNNTHCVDGVNTFSCVCNAGYTGAVPHCTEIDECDDKPCMNGATCHDLLNDFSCSCLEGFTGRFCEVNINECASNPCGNGAICEDGIGFYTCNCSPGYTGRNCETDINECDPNPCTNSIYCKDMISGYQCECVPGWTGTNCDVNINECASQPCVHGQCVDLMNNFTCSCDEGYKGRFCEENINECDDSPCFNGGTCTDLVANFSCECPPEFMGRQCREIYNACHSTPCQNNGTCRTRMPSHEYTCNCLPGYEGNSCEIDINECEGVTCGPGQMCFDLQNRYECGCPIGFSGPACTVNINECSSNPCINGTCIDGIGNYVCQCPAGMTGRHCETDINECDSSPCGNGVCQNLPGHFMCFCTPGFTGIRCDIEFNECLSSPCQNGAICNDLVNNYSCSCIPGFTGQNCETNINECASDPCQNGGTCTDRINMYQCSCLPGFSGESCEINIDECASSPCLNGGMCVDLINGFECNCTDSGFSGQFCETNIDDCVPDPCENGASCEDGIKNYTCHCFSGYEGKNCEVDIPECKLSPCLNNGLCLENSNRTLYDMNYLGFFPEFSYQTAGGYRCICSLGFTGQNCEVNIDDCEVNNCTLNGQCIDGINDYHCECTAGYEGIYCGEEINECERLRPCQNNAECRDLIADYQCICPNDYGDKNCSTFLQGCFSNGCINNSTCKAILDEHGNHDYVCECPSGFYGRYCEEITTVSFYGNGSWPLHQQTFDLQNYSLSLYFRTTLPEGVIAQGTVTQVPLEYVLYIWNTGVNLSVYDSTGIVAELSSKSGQTDAEWKHVQVTFRSSIVTLNVSNHVVQRNIPGIPGIFSVDFHTVIGSSSLQGYLSRQFYSKSLPNFIGCIQDVVVNGDVAIPDDNMLVEAQLGCPREDQCITSSCVHGSCEDKWTSYECICSRPYFGKHCEYSHQAATFGYKGLPSSAELTIPTDHQNELSDVIDVTFFMRTRKTNGLLFYLGSNVIDHMLLNGETNEQNNGFLIAVISDGKLKVLLKTEYDRPTEVLLDKRLDDGEYHFIQVKKEREKLIVKANETTSWALVQNYPLHSHILYIGGFPNMNRKKRQVASSLLKNTVVSYTSDNSVENFKGVVKDFRLNNMVVVFYEMNKTESDDSGSSPNEIGIATLHNTMEGVLSDNLCEPNSPCLRNAVCHDIWNEFRCDCPKGYRGKICDEEEPCKNNMCPDKSECRNLIEGYECVAPVSFSGKNSTIQYQVQSTTKSISNITFSFRSKVAGTILWLENVGLPRYFLHVELLKDSLEVKWDFGNPPEITSLKTVSQALDNDGEWHDVKIVFKDNVVELHVQKRQSHMNKMNGNDKVPMLSEDNYLKTLGEVLSNGAVIYLGYSPEADTTFKGCLEEVRIGGDLLQFFKAPMFPTIPNPYSLISMNNVEIGCILCWNEDCIHGSCEDSSHSYNCDCKGGYEGQFCTIDMCDSQNPCQNDGICFHQADEIVCSCTPLYTGPNCTEENKCASSPCRNDGVCIHDLVTSNYNCICDDNFEGVNCEKRKIVNCTNSPCIHGNCKDIENSSTKKYQCECFEGYEGDDCEHVMELCKGDICGPGYCSIIKTPDYAKYKCDCKMGFSGTNCEINIDDCVNHMCVKGDCIDEIASYSCECYPGYEGRMCENRITRCGYENEVCYNGTCKDTEDGYECECEEGYFGQHCNVFDACDSSKCSDHGECNRHHDETERFFNFSCTCSEGYARHDCSEKLAITGNDDDTSLVLMILIPVMTVFILCLLIGAVIFLRIAKKKRATRGTYSPSRQEMFGSRVEMNHVMKPPPEERLI